MSTYAGGDVTPINLLVTNDILSTSEAADYLSKSPRYLRANFKRLGIKGYRVGRHLRFRRTELDQWLESRIAS